MGHDEREAHAQVLLGRSYAHGRVQHPECTRSRHTKNTTGGSRTYPTLGFSARTRREAAKARSKVGEMYPRRILTRTKGVQMLQPIYPESSNKSRRRLRRNRILVRTREDSDSDLDRNLKLDANSGTKACELTQYRQLIGSLIYLMITRPDLSYPVSLLSQFMQTPRDIHLDCAMRVLRYVSGTMDCGILYDLWDTPTPIGSATKPIEEQLPDLFSPSSFV